MPTVSVILHSESYAAAVCRNSESARCPLSKNNAMKRIHSALPSGVTSI